MALCFPEEGLVYDYRLDDAGISHPEEDEDETNKRKVSTFPFFNKLNPHVENCVVIHGSGSALQSNDCYCVSRCGGSAGWSPPGT